MDREEHGKARAGKITGTCAHTIMYGSQSAWDTLINQLWADDGTQFAEAVGGARGHGHDWESVGAAKFWDRHPEYDHEDPKYADYSGPIREFRGMLGYSPDRILKLDGLRIAGLEIKSPTCAENVAYHIIAPGADPRGNVHFSQCQHSLLASGLNHWYQVVHFEEQYFEYRHDIDGPWRERYIAKLHEFIRQYNGAKPKPRRRLRITDDE